MIAWQLDPACAACAVRRCWAAAVAFEQAVAPSPRASADMNVVTVSLTACSSPLLPPPQPASTSAAAAAIRARRNLTPTSLQDRSVAFLGGERLAAALVRSRRERQAGA